MITSMSGCVMHSDLWPWPISSRLFSCDIAYFLDWIYMWHKYNPRGVDVSRTIFRSKVKVTWVVQIFLRSGQRSPNRSPIYNFCCFRLWLVTYWVPSHKLNQCWLIAIWTLEGTDLQWKSNQSFTLKKTYFKLSPFHGNECPDPAKFCGTSSDNFSHGRSTSCTLTIHICYIWECSYNTICVIVHTIGLIIPLLLSASSNICKLCAHLNVE